MYNENFLWEQVSALNGIVERLLMG